MTLPNWLALAALIAVSLLFWSLRQFLLLLFAGLVLAMALCTLVGSLRERRSMPRPLALVLCLVGLLCILGVTTAAGHSRLDRFGPGAVRLVWTAPIGKA